MPARGSRGDWQGDLTQGRSQIGDCLPLSMRRQFVVVPGKLEKRQRSHVPVGTAVGNFNCQPAQSIFSSPDQVQFGLQVPHKHLAQNTFHHHCHRSSVPPTPAKNQGKGPTTHAKGWWIRDGNGGTGIRNQG
nr:uncharacterized protein LOC121502918 isoform X1 [Drosophila kikkawai]